MSTPVKQPEAEQAPSSFTAIPSTPKRPLPLPPAALQQDQHLAAIIVQAWWRRHQAVNKAAAAMLLQRPQLQQAAQVLALQSSTGFEDILSKIQSKELISSIVGLLAAVSGPDFSAPPMSPRGARGSPRSLEVTQQQQARKFLTALMIKHHPEEVIVSSSSDDDGNGNTVSLGDLEARLLCVAANLALVSAVGLIQALEGLEEQQQQQQQQQQPSGGALGIFRLRLNTFNFARTFMNASLQVLQARQARGMAASFLSSYGEAYAYLRDAERSQEEVLIAAARQSLDKVRMGIMQVLGREATEKHCRSVEEALELEEPFVVLMPGEIKVMLPPVRARTPRPSSSSSNPMEEGVGDSVESRSRTSSSSSSSRRSRSPSGAYGQAAEAGAGQLPAVPSSLAALLRNEHLAHEIILNPDFKLEEKRQALDSSASGSAEGALAAELGRVREAMEKVFWDRLVMAMTPAEQEGPEDFVPGAVVQLRFGGPQGSLFAARVEGVNAEEGTLDVVYLMDGVKERRPLGDFRLKSDRLDYEPLLALLEDVREKLTELTPHRKDLAAELQAHLDTQLLGQMARQGLLDAATIRGLLGFVVERLMALQAPLRAVETGAWFSGIEVQAQAAMQEGEGGQGGSGKPTPAFVALLPRVFQTIFERIDETRRDIANAHVQMLRPFLIQHGVAYERQKFAERLREGEVRLVHTQAWLHEVLASAERVPRLPALAQGDAQTHRTLLADALLCLLRKPVRLDNPVTAKLPETLFYDGRRLAALRDELDRLSLVAVYSSLLRQFLVIQGPSLPLGQSNPVGNILVALEMRLYTVLQDDGAVTLPHLVEEVVQSANQIYAAAGTTMSSEQAATLRGMLKNTASLENPLFNLLFARLADVLSLYARGDTAGARELVGHFGFRSFDVQLAATGDGLRRVLEHNLAVHGELYSRLLQDAASALLLDAQVGTSNQQGGGGASSNSSSMQVFP